jgi:hypothetical protein
VQRIGGCNFIEALREFRVGDDNFLKPVNFVLKRVGASIMVLEHAAEVRVQSNQLFQIRRSSGVEVATDPADRFEPRRPESPGKVPVAEHSHFKFESVNQRIDYSVEPRAHDSGPDIDLLRRHEPILTIAVCFMEASRL